jgi:CO/xanthine dehydrogenase FAD-binding subunit
VPARFERPASVAEATQLLAAGGWSVLAGGTDVYPGHVGRPLTGPLVDITGIEALHGIRRTPSGWSIGATTTWTDLLRADLPPLFDALKLAAREVGGMQIQNVGTLGGNLCNASPAADGTPALLALDAEAVLRSSQGERSVPVADFVIGNRRTTRAADELLVALRVPPRSPRARSTFLKMGGRRYLSISMTMVAVAVDLDTDNVIRNASIAVGSCSAAARRLPALERKLAGERARAALASAVDDADLEPLTPIDDLRASAAYRRDATATLLRRAIVALCR